MHTTTKAVAWALLYGIKMAYKNKLQESRREVLEDLLDDMALALTCFSIREKNERIAKYAGIISELLEELDWPEFLRPENRHKRPKYAITTDAHRRRRSHRKLARRDRAHTKRRK